MSKKKVKIAVVAIIAVVLVLYILYYIFGVKITNFYHNDPDKIQEIRIRTSDGKSMTITGHEDIRLITEFFDELRFSRRYRSSRYEGWGYAYDIYYGDKEFSITLGGDSYVNHKIYEVIGDVQRAGELYEQFKNKYPINDHL